jgi:hypothetical protein
MAQNESERTTTQTRVRPESEAEQSRILDSAADRANDLADWASSLSDQVPELVDRGRQATADAAKSLDDMPPANLVLLTAAAAGSAIGAVLSGGNRLVAGASLLVALAAVGSLVSRQAGRPGRPRGRT